MYRYVLPVFFISSASPRTKKAFIVVLSTKKQKLERRKAKKEQEPSKDITRGGENSIGSRSVPVKKAAKSVSSSSFELPRSLSPPKKELSDRERQALAASQARSANRLASQNKSEGNLSAVGEPKDYQCSDGITKMPYLVLGSVTVASRRDSFVIVHDFFDTCDATAIYFKPIVQRHDGCQVLCFNYPGQANTTWPRPPPAEKKRGAKDVIINNDWIADKLHELLQYAEADGDILLSNKFHIVGIGNGAW